MDLDRLKELTCKSPLSNRLRYISLIVGSPQSNRNKWVAKPKYSSHKQENGNKNNKDFRLLFLLFLLLLLLCVRTVVFAPHFCLPVQTDHSTVIFVSQLPNSNYPKPFSKRTLRTIFFFWWNTSKIMYRSVISIFGIVDIWMTNREKKATTMKTSNHRRVTHRTASTYRTT